MTLEEARETFLNRGWIKAEGGTYFDGDKWREAVMVISDYLQKEQCEDCISRQAAIDALEERLQASGYSNVALVSELNRSIGYLMRLPSAQPEQQIPQMRGWVCPVCGRGLSPYTSVCPCNNGKGWEITC